MGYGCFYPRAGEKDSFISVQTTMQSHTDFGINPVFLPGRPMPECAVSSSLKGPAYRLPAVPVV